MIRLSRRDLEAAFGFVRFASSVQGTEPFAEPVVERLARLIRCDSIVYHEWLLNRRLKPRVSVAFPAIVTPPAVAEATKDLCSSYPLSILRLSEATEPCVLSDLISSRRLHRLEYYHEVLRPLGIEHQMRMWLPAPAGMSRVFVVNRSATDGTFDHRDRTVLALLRPFLIVLRAHFGRPPPTADAGELTEREAQILGWVARGRTNREIAELLCVSTHTVRKHLENVYVKLGVHTRTAAVARAAAHLN